LEQTVQERRNQLKQWNAKMASIPSKASTQRLGNFHLDGKNIPQVSRGDCSKLLFTKGIPDADVHIIRASRQKPEFELYRQSLAYPLLIS
jgi:hypothetical protein